MHEGTNREPEPVGAFRAEPWSDDGRASLVAFGDEPQAVVLAGLRGVLEIGRAHV